MTGLTSAQVKSKFLAFDNNGDGVLSKKEFQKLLKNLGISVDDDAVDLIISRFDKDGDGHIDMYEFKDFIENEVRQLHQSSTSVDDHDLTKQPNNQHQSQQQLRSSRRPASAPRRMSHTTSGRLER